MEPTTNIDEPQARRPVQAVVTQPDRNSVERLSKDRIQSVLIQLAAEMVRGTNMPSEFIEDWKLPVSTSRKTRAKIIEQSRKSRSQCIEWSATLRKVYELFVHGLSD